MKNSRFGLSDLYNVIFHVKFLLLYEEICHFPIKGIDFKEQLIVNKVLDRLLIVVLLEHTVHESETKHFSIEVLINCLLILAPYPWGQLS